MDAFRHWKAELNDEHIVFGDTSQYPAKPQAVPTDSPSPEVNTSSPFNNWEEV